VKAKFCLGPRVYKSVDTKPYERKSTDPLYRPLRLFTLDPSVSSLLGAEDIVDIPYEPLEPGPRGALLLVENSDGESKMRYQQADLEDSHVLLGSGYKASPSDPRFHQQMVYAVSSLVYDAFKRALGRNPSWGFKRTNYEEARLIIVPHAGQFRNAYYDKEEGKLCFGYYQANEVTVGRNLPSSIIFTCLSHDIVAHEFTHALLDGLRAHFTLPTSSDVLAFHEAFADLVAIFQHFRHKTLLEKAVAESRGNLRDVGLLNFLAQQFGETTGSGRALRAALLKRMDSDGKKPNYPQYKEYKEKFSESHALGSVLVSAVFEAFYTIYDRKIERYRKLATNGSGVLPPGEIPSGLQEIVVEEASKLAQQFLNICIRAIDYCPPVDLTFGEFLRAMITADFDLVYDDPWGYREAWMDAFRLHGIFPEGVSSLSEDALLWQGATSEIPEIADLRFGRLAFDGDPGQPSSQDAVKKQAQALGEVIANPTYMEAFGLANPLAHADVDLPCIESIRSLRRVGPDGQVSFGLVAEVTQHRQVSDSQGNTFNFYGGSTIILGSRGEIRYIIHKRVLSDDNERLEKQLEFVEGAGKKYWEVSGGKRVSVTKLFKMLHFRDSSQG
jgi:hypothetical protein